MMVSHLHLSLVSPNESVSSLELMICFNKFSISTFCFLLPNLLIYILVFFGAEQSELDCHKNRQRDVLSKVNVNCVCAYD